MDTQAAGGDGVPVAASRCGGGNDAIHGRSLGLEHQHHAGADRASRMAGEPPDIAVAPRLAHLRLLDFHRANEAIDEGHRAVGKSCAHAGSGPTRRHGECIRNLGPARGRAAAMNIQEASMKTIPIQEAVGMIPDGACLMIGGFMACGTPEPLMDELVRQGKRDLTVIANDTAMPGVGIGKLVRAKLLRKVIASHIGLNKETQEQMIAGELEVELVPQGTLIERIRAGGSGLGGILTPTGVGTVVEEGEAEDLRRWPRLSAGDRAARRLCARSCVRERLSGQPGLCAHGAQLQPRDRDRRHDRHRHRGTYRTRRRDRARPGRHPGSPGGLRHRGGMKPWTHRP